jgi:hypothetical protein
MRALFPVFNALRQKSILRLPSLSSAGEVAGSPRDLRSEIARAMAESNGAQIDASHREQARLASLRLIDMMAGQAGNGPQSGRAAD